MLTNIFKIIKNFKIGIHNREKQNAQILNYPTNKILCNWIHCSWVITLKYAIFVYGFLSLWARSA